MYVYMWITVKGQIIVISIVSDILQYNILTLMQNLYKNDFKTR